MGVAERLRRLDDRVLGRPRPATARSSLGLLLVGAAGTVAVLGAAVVRDDPSLLSGSGGFFGITVAGAVRSYVGLPRSSPWRARTGRRLVLLAVALTWVGAVVAVYATSLGGDDDPGQPTPRECVELRAEVFNGLADAQELEALRRCPAP